MDRTQITVRDKAGTYLAGPVNGLRASSTAGYDFAAKALAAKLWPGHAHEVRLLLQTQGHAVFWAQRAQPMESA